VPGDLVGTQGDWRENYPDYLGCCHAVDDGLGRIRQALRNRGLADNTLVIYTSDHGSHFCTRNPEYKRSCHDGCLRIPLIIRGPGFPAGRVPTGLVSLLDTTPTVLTAAAVPVPGYMGGRALQPLANGAAKAWRDLVYAEISEDHIGRTVRTAKWKYAVRAPGKEPWSGGARPGSDVYDEACLYDLQPDPHERRNLVADPTLADVRADLCRQLLACMAAAGETAPVIRPATKE
jgi:arylsulfatase A-like enzyme